MRNVLCWSLAVATAMSVSGASAETISLQSNQSRKVSDHISVNLEFFGEPFVSFDPAPSPSHKGNDALSGFKTLKVFDAGKIWMITIESTTRQATKVRTTEGCKNGSRASACVFRVDSVPASAPALRASDQEFSLPQATVFKKLNDSPLLYVRYWGKAIMAVTAGGATLLQPWTEEGRTRKLGSVTLSVSSENPKTMKMSYSGKTTSPTIVDFIPEP